MGNVRRKNFGSNNKFDCESLLVMIALKTTALDGVNRLKSVDYTKGRLTTISPTFSRDMRGFEFAFHVSFFNSEIRTKFDEVLPPLTVIIVKHIAFR